MKLFRFISYEIRFIKNYISFVYLRNKANIYHKMTGKQYHIVLQNNGKLKLVDNTVLNVYNKNVKGKAKITIRELLQMSYYSTK